MYLLLMKKLFYKPVYDPSLKKNNNNNIVFRNFDWEQYILFLPPQKIANKIKKKKTNKKQEIHQQLLELHNGLTDSFLENCELTYFNMVSFLFYSSAQKRHAIRQNFTEYGYHNTDIC